MRRHRWQQGNAWTLGLIALGVCVLIAVPGVSLASTSLLGQRGAGERVLDRYTADAGAEHALWRLQYESGFASSLNPSATYTRTANGRTSAITVTAAPTPTPFPNQCPPVQGGSLCVVVSANPPVVRAGVYTVFTITLSIHNNGTSTVHFNTIGDLLPAGFTYMPGSTSSSGIGFKAGATFGEPAISLVNGRQQLLWSYGSPLPGITSETVATATFQASATPADGTYADDSWVEGNPTDIGVVSGVVSATTYIVAYYPEYDVTSQSGGVTIKTRAKEPNTGITVRSWQVQ